MPGTTFDVSQWRSAASLTATGAVNDNTFTLSGWTSAVVGGAGSDLLSVTVASDMTLAASTLLVANGSPQVTHAQIETVALSGGASANTIDAQLFTGIAKLTGNGGTTVHDAVISSLDQLLTGWNSTTETYAQKITRMRTTGVGTSMVRLNTTSVLDDNQTDLLSGEADLDWFFAEITANQLGY